jgi:hypothetical protein
VQLVGTCPEDSHSAKLNERTGGIKSVATRGSYVESVARTHTVT